MKTFIGILFVLALVGCTKKENEDGKKVLNFALTEDLKSLDPAICYDTVSNTVMPLGIESLFQYKYTKMPLELEPLLSDGMPEVSKDKLTYTIKIKKGVLFADDPAFPNGKGRELKAKDFLFGWKRLLLPELQSPGTWIFDDRVVGWNEFRKKLTDGKDKAEQILLEEVEGLKALDEYTLQIKLIKPYPQLLNALAMGFGAPVAKEVTDKYGQQGLNERMVGTGPYRLVSFTKGSKIVVEKNPTFHGEKYPSTGDEAAKAAGLLEFAGADLPLSDKVVFQIIKEDQPRWLQFLKGNIDAAGIPKDSFGSAIANGQLIPDLVNKGLVLQKEEEAVIWYLNFNMKDKLLGANANLRKAMAMAINRDEFIEKFLNGRGYKATSIVPRVLAGNTERKETIGDLNLEKAKELLAKAGFPNGDGLPVIKYDIRGSSTTSRQEAEYIKDSLAKIGVKIEVVVNTFPAYLEKEKNGNLQFFMGGWNADYPDAENFLFLLYSKNIAPGPNASNYVNPAFDKLYEKMAQMSPSPERSAIIRQAEDVALNDGVWSMMFYPVIFHLNHGWIKTYRPNSLISNDIKYYGIDVAKRLALKPKL